MSEHEGMSASDDPWVRWMVETIEADPDGPVAEAVRRDLVPVVERLARWWASVPREVKDRIAEAQS